MIDAASAPTGSPRGLARQLETVAQLLGGDAHRVEALGHVERARLVDRAQEPRRAPAQPLGERALPHAPQGLAVDGGRDGLEPCAQAIEIERDRT